MPPRKSTRKRKASSDSDYEPPHAGPGAGQGAEDEPTDEDLLEPSSVGRKASTSRKGKAKAVEESDGEDYAPPAKKKAKASTAAKGKGKGKGKSAKPKKLELFQSMPLDVLALVMSQLDTKTLLAMSRTCSALRTLLHSSQGTSCWKAARRSMGIPDLRSTDLPEWMYASLLFDSTCHICHKPRAKTVDFDLRVRCCARCMRANSKQESKVGFRPHSKVFECVPESLWSPYDDFGDGGKTYTFFWVPTVSAVSRRLRELDGKAGFDEYVKERKANKAAAKLDAVQIRRWEATHRSQQFWDAKRIVADRQRKIKENLLALGYTAAEFSAIQNHSLLKQESELTDRAWTMAKPKLIAAIEEYREGRRRLELAAAMRLRAYALKPYYAALQASIPSGDARMLFPPWGNFLHLPSVKQLYEPEDAQPTADDLNRARAAILSEAQAFGDEIRSAFFNELTAAHLEAGTSMPGTLQDADGAGSAQVVEALARYITSAVRCPTCSTLATFPAILDHYKVCTSSALTVDSISTSARHVRVIDHVLAAINTVQSGHNAATTTTDQLYALGGAFDCQTCQPQQSAVGPASWSTVLQPTKTRTGMVSHLFWAHDRNATLPTVVFTPRAPDEDDAADTGGPVAAVDA